MSTILYLAALLVALLTILVVIQHHIICRLQRELGRSLEAWTENLRIIHEKLEDEGDSWKNG
jgi:sensor domain CHASE-containing protein